MAGSYFDKFIIDQIERAEAVRERKKERIIEDDKDLKRNLLRRYRERSVNLIYRNVQKRNDKNG